MFKLNMFLCYNQGGENFRYKSRLEVSSRVDGKLLNNFKRYMYTYKRTDSSNFLGTINRWARDGSLRGTFEVGQYLDAVLIAV